MKNRLYNLDYLRGVSALFIMIYHYYSWSFGALNSEDLLGRIGIYGVAIFYVLSGLTLYHVYNETMIPTRSKIKSFFIKRIIRIYPLLWLVTILSIAISRNMPHFLDLFLNLSGLFGLFDWSNYYSVGVWSIGNELVFYLFFPLNIFFLKKYINLFILSNIIILIIFLYFAFFIFTDTMPLESQWANYVNPWNQFLFFQAGILIGYFFGKKEFNTNLLILLCSTAIFVFVFFPVNGDLINLIIGNNRLLLSACCIVICFSIFKMKINIHGLVHKSLSQLGESSYSLYLLHPIIYIVINGISKVLFGENISSIFTIINFILSAALTLGISPLVYNHFEKYFIKLGRNKFE